MSTDVKIESVYQTGLKRHFKKFFGCFCRESAGRFISDISSSFANARVGISEAIEIDIRFFHEQNMPFCWYVDEESDPGFKQKLLAVGLQDLGIFQGMIGQLNHPFTTKLRSDCAIELVQDQLLMREFGSLICPIFGITGDAMGQYEQVLWEEPRLYNWVLKKGGRVISALSTFVDGPIVSVWNVATDPVFRRQGYCHELWKHALNQAISKSCRTSMTYLTSHGMAFSICKRLGYETKWHFHAYLCSASPLY